MQPPTEEITLHTLISAVRNIACVIIYRSGQSFLYEYGKFGEIAYLSNGAMASLVSRLSTFLT